MVIDSSTRKDVLFVAEVATLLTAGAFFVSAIVNSSIFSNWNISYLQVASPADVVMGGLDLLFRSWPVLVGILAGYASSRRFGDASKLLIFPVVLLFALSFAGNALLRDVGLLSLWREMAGILIVASMWYWTWGLFSSDSKEWDGSTIFGAINAAFGCAILYTLVSMTPGFWPAGTVFRANGAQPCERPIVLWSGSSATIVECPDHRRIIRTDGQQIITPGPASDRSVGWLTDFLRSH